ncbi:hypothetical protein NDU88_003482 [Pleurodeles waltl]|uniref:Uncharacterized protein n=1 Tax=Pleurodeles waltl TaxID=8319 RepID=A0AAV7Q9W1_PLEWA|nr:hypothetical protein NDU88_003482 [Pleurodeles waltl]
MHDTSPPLLMPQRQQCPPRAACTAGQWTQGPASPKATLRLDPATPQCSSRLVSQPGAQDLQSSSSGTPRHVRAQHCPRQASAARRPPGPPPLLQAVRPQGTRAVTQPEPLQAVPACSRRRHRPRGSALALGGSSGVPGPLGHPAVWGVRRDPQAAHIHPKWGRRPVSEA